jgi:transcription antitermination factor NusG
MTTTAISGEATFEDPRRAAAWFEPRWYAAHTCANHEKRVAEQLRTRGVEHFLPLYSTVHRWKDRRVRLQLPLFPGYVFVHLPLAERLRVLQVPSVARLVGFGERPVALPAHEIDVLRDGLGGGFPAQPHPYLTVGRRVRIRNGPLAGLEGILLRKKGNFRIVLSLDLIMRSIVLEADAADLDPLPASCRHGAA